MLQTNIWKYGDEIYDLLKQYVTDFDWLSLKTDKVNIFAEYVEYVNAKSLEFCKCTIPNIMITVTVKPIDPPFSESLTSYSCFVTLKAEIHLNNKHFLLICPRYKQMRGEMILSIPQVNER